MPRSPFEPCIPTRGSPAGPDWLHEIKHDGYRLFIQRDGKRVRLWRLGRLIGGSMDGKPDRDISLDQGNFSDEWKRANRAERFALLTRRLRDRIEQRAAEKFVAGDFEGNPAGIILRGIDFRKIGD